MHTVGHPQVEEREKVESLFIVKMPQTSQIWEQNKHPDSWRPENPFKEEYSENYSETCYNHVINHQRQREYWKQWEKSDLSLIRDIRYQRISQEEFWGQKGVRWYIQSAEKNKTK